MKKLTAVVKPFKLDDAVRALQAVGVTGLTISEVRGFGRQKGHSELYRGAEYVVEFLPKIQLEVVVPEELVMRATQALVEATRTGRVGDGKLFIQALVDAVRIRTGERGEAALI